VTEAKGDREMRVKVREMYPAEFSSMLNVVCIRVHVTESDENPIRKTHISAKDHRRARCRPRFRFYRSGLGLGLPALGHRH
jgi:hypothetical protein